MYHLSAKTISRGQAKTVLAAAAYRSGTLLTLDKEIAEKYGFDKTRFDYRPRTDVLHAEIMLPERAPGWARDRERLWNGVESFENRRDSQLARDFVIAIPRELSFESQLELLRSYCQRNFVSQGMVADFAIHWDEVDENGLPNNPHAHILTTMRRFDGDGFGKKVREWNSKANLLEWRMDFSVEANLALERAGFETRIDHRSYEARGLDIEPTQKAFSPKLNGGRGGLSPRVLEENRCTKERNEARFLASPELVVRAVAQQKSTFSLRDVRRFLRPRVEEARLEELTQSAIGATNLRHLGADESGELRFSSQEIIDIELMMLDDVAKMNGRKGHQVREKHQAAPLKSRTMSEEQEAAFRYITAESSDIAVVQGYAGAGKSYMLGAAKEAWESAGYTVRGAALAGKAADGLQNDSGINSRTIDSLLLALENGTTSLGKSDVLVVDEAGMVDTRKMQRLVSEVRDAGAKLVLVGDSRQLQAIDAGAAMRAIGQRVGAVTLSGVRRQNEEWMQEASKLMGKGQALDGLAAYESRGLVQEHETQTDAATRMVAEWAQRRKDEPGCTQLLLAYRRTEVAALNVGARQVMEQENQLGKSVRVQVTGGEKEFAAGDRLYFLKNDRMLGVKNGSLGTVIEASPQSLKVKLDDSDRTVVIDTEKYKHFDHGYACTVHKSQGATVDYAHVLASGAFDSSALYVAMSRHREEVKLHWSREEFEDERKMQRSVSRAAEKTNAIDYVGLHGLKETSRPAYERAGPVERAQENQLKELKQLTEKKLLQRVVHFGKLGQEPTLDINKAKLLHPRMQKIAEEISQTEKRMAPLQKAGPSGLTQKGRDLLVSIEQKRHKLLTKSGKIAGSSRVTLFAEEKVTESEIQNLKARREAAEAKFVLHQKVQARLVPDLNLSERRFAELAQLRGAFLETQPDPTIALAMIGQGEGTKLWDELRECEEGLNEKLMMFAMTTGGALNAYPCLPDGHEAVLDGKKYAAARREIEVKSQAWAQIIAQSPEEASQARLGLGEHAQLYREFLEVRGEHRALESEMTKEVERRFEARERGPQVQKRAFSSDEYFKFKERTGQLEQIANLKIRGAEEILHDMHEVRLARGQVEFWQGELEKIRQEKAQLEREHPIKARLAKRGMGGAGVALLKREEDREKELGAAQKEHSVLREKMRPQAEKEAKKLPDRIKKAKESLEKLRPYLETARAQHETRAQQTRELGMQRERGPDWER